MQIQDITQWKKLITLKIEESYWMSFEIISNWIKVNRYDFLHLSSWKTNWTNGKQHRMIRVNSQWSDSNALVHGIHTNPYKKYTQTIHHTLACFISCIGIERTRGRSCRGQYLCAFFTTHHLNSCMNNEHKISYLRERKGFAPYE